MVESTDDFVKPTNQRTTEEEAKETNLPAKYLKFTEKHARFWFRLNLFNILISLAFGAAGWMVMGINIEG